MDVRNSRGKIDKIMQKFVINPAPISSQSSITRGDHDEIEIFLEICLIPSRIDQKLKNKGRIHGFLKGKLARRSWAIEAVVEAVLGGRGSDSLGRCRGSPIGGKLVSIFASKEPRSRLDRATIAPRSGHDRVLIVILAISRSPSGQVGEL